MVDVETDEPLLECVVNVSEGCDPAALAALSAAAGSCLLDRHSDCGHHRSVFTLAGGENAVVSAVQDLARAAVSLLDLRSHVGAHPRFGVLDVVPWVALEGWPLRDARGAGAERGAEGPGRLCAVGSHRARLAGVPVRPGSLLAGGAQRGLAYLAARLRPP